MRKFDKIIIGAGLYGCYAANLCGKRNETVLVLEYDEAPFQRATCSDFSVWITDRPCFLHSSSEICRTCVT